MDSERVLSHQTVVVRGDRILAIGPAATVSVPADARRIDGRGKFLMPGLGDMHAHNGQDDATMFLYVANGVTTLRDLGIVDPEWSQDSVLPKLRERLASGELIGPRLYAPLRTCGADQSVVGLSLAQVVDCFTAGKALGFDSFKIYNHSPAEIDTIVEAAKRAGIRIVGHAPTKPGYGGLAKALAIPYWSIEHLWGYLDAVLGVSDVWSAEHNIMWEPDSLVADTAAWMKPGFRLDSARLRRVVEATRRAAVWNVPTLAALDASLVSLRTEDAESFGAGGWAGRVLGRVLELNRVIVKALQDGGAGLLLGSDYGLPGFSLHGELQAFVQAGLTPYQALATGTRNVASFLGTEQDAGTIAVGKQADLLLLDGNPLADVGYTAGPAGVMARGHWLPRAEIDAQLDHIGTYRDVDLRAQRGQVWLHAGQPNGMSAPGLPSLRGQTKPRSPRAP